MKLLLDACVWPGAASELENHGHEVLRVHDFPENPSDEEILALALRENRIIVTLDKDFGELAVAFGRTHAGIIRIVDFPISRHATVCFRALEQHGDELSRGAIVTAEPGRLRLRPAP
jgi:predicted nuclease of predicted toxin-antitoxin system